MGFRRLEQAAAGSSDSNARRAMGQEGALCGQRRRLRLHLAVVAALIGGLVLLPNGWLLRALATNRDMARMRTTYPHLVSSRLDSCLVCHPAGSWSLNPYGQDFASAGSNFAAIEPLDSDADGFSNREEILALTFPGDPSDFPVATATVSPTVPVSPTAEATLSPTTTSSPQPTAVATAVPTGTATLEPIPTSLPSWPGQALLPLAYRE